MKPFPNFDGNKCLVLVSMAVILTTTFLYQEHFSLKQSIRELTQKTQVIFHTV